MSGIELELMEKEQDWNSTLSGDIVYDSINISLLGRRLSYLKQNGTFRLINKEKLWDAIISYNKNSGVFVKRNIGNLRPMDEQVSAALLYNQGEWRLNDTVELFFRTFELDIEYDVIEGEDYIFLMSLLPAGTIIPLSTNKRDIKESILAKVLKHYKDSDRSIKDKIMKHWERVI